jgi:protein tyrosine phosphatase (PTP) superfamily phosphohydrolase (DUF442 family)
MLETIRDFLWITPTFATAGQPTERQLTAVAAAGFETVINLIHPSSTFFLPTEEALIARLGLTYVWIPVVWTRPERADFDAFCAALDDHRDRRCLVHCAANKRVSAFVYLYRTVHRKEADDDARADLYDIWRPEGVWADFIAAVRGCPLG